MATDSSILAWRFPWTEEPGELLSMGSPNPSEGVQTAIAKAWPGSFCVSDHAVKMQATGLSLSSAWIP